MGVDRFHKDVQENMDSSTSMRFGDLSWTTNPQTANQLAELGKRLNEGVKNVEVGALSQQVFDAIPKQHFEEMRRLSKMGGVELTMHAPLTDPAGFTERGWAEHSRNLAGQEFKDVIERAHKLNPSGDMTVNFHSSGGGVAATVWEKKEKGKPEEKQFISAVNTRTGEIKPIQREKMDWLTGEKIMTPQDKLDNLNHVSWDQDIMQIMSMKHQKDEINNQQMRWRTQSPQGLKLLELEMKKKKGTLTSQEKMMRGELSKEDKFFDAHREEIDSVMNSQLNSLYNDYKHYTESNSDEVRKNKGYHNENLKMFEKVKKLYKKRNEYVGERLKSEDKKFKEWLLKNPNIPREEIIEKQEGIREEALRKAKEKGYDVSPERLSLMLKGIQAPERFRPVDDVAREKAAETFAGVAVHAYEKYKDKAPLISIENVYPEWTLSRAESLKGMVEDSKKLFINKLKEKGVGEGEAKRIAETKIGVTWDLGHINQLRKYGFTKKDIIKEAEKIGKHVKHIHITDNFGYNDSHLAPGMGNVPIKEQLEAIEKKVGKDEYRRIKGVIEGGGLFQQFQANPVPYTMDREGINSPFYTYEGPSWGDVKDLYSSYMFGFGDVLPDVHFKTQGGGFSMLPKELGGGGSGGDKGRFANNQ